MIDVGLFLAYILIAVCILTAIGMPLLKAFGDPQSLKKMGLGVGSLLVVFFIGYALSDGTPYGDASSGTTKLAGGALITFYILSFVAIGGIIFTEIKKALE